MFHFNYCSFFFSVLVCVSSSCRVLCVPEEGKKASDDSYTISTKLHALVMTLKVVLITTFCTSSCLYLPCMHIS